MSPPSPLIRLEAVGRIFDQGSVVAIQDIDLAIEPAESVAIVGASGSGKSSVVNVMSGIDLPSSGRVLWQGQPTTSRHEWTARRSRDIGIVFQEFNLFPTLTALENVEMAMLAKRHSASEQRAGAIAALTRVGLSARLHHLPQALSGGERQRTAIARSIVNDPQLILADEPTGNLDSANSALVIDLLFELHRAKKMALVLVTHDEALARRCERCIRLKDGRIIEDRRQPAAAPPQAKEAMP